jgi:hypothetical protein
LNAETNKTQTLDWLQFVVHQLGNGQGLWPWINIWLGGSNPQILWNQTVANPVANMPQAARIPAGYSLPAIHCPAKRWRSEGNWRHMDCF